MIKCHVVYLRNGRKPYGTAVVLEDGRMGVSLCHEGLDHFQKKLGVRIALGRALQGEPGSCALMKNRRGDEVFDVVDRLMKTHSEGRLPPNYIFEGEL